MALTKPAGGWTYDDLFDLPDDGKHYEIVDGELYELPQRESDHGLVVMNLIGLLLPIADQLGGQLFTGPLGLFLAGADPVQPDLLLLTANQLHLISKRGIEGAPALVIEVFSPSNPEHDRITKRALYARGGVPEYWLVSPEAATIEVLVLEAGAYCTHMRAGNDEPMTSTALPDLSFPASAAFR